MEINENYFLFFTIDEARQTYISVEFVLGEVSASGWPAFSPLKFYRTYTEILVSSGKKSIRRF